jgi:hypothetical protein
MPLNAARTDWAGGIYKPGLKGGGGGGGPNELTCRPGDAMHVLTVAAGPWDEITVVKTVYIGCHDLDSANYYSVSLPALSTVSGERTFSCKPGDWGTGLIGNVGALVDRVGLQCGRIPASTTTPPSTDPAIEAGCPRNYNYETGRCNRPVKRIGKGSPPLTKEECAAEGSLWVEQKGRCIGTTLLGVLRRACEKKGADHRFDEQTAQCIGPQDGGQQGGAQNICRVLKPGAVYDRPDGNKIDELEAQTEGVTLLEKQGTDWFHVKWPAGEGWVYSGPGYEDAIACP